MNTQGNVAAVEKNKRRDKASRSKEAREGLCLQRGSFLVLTNSKQIKGLYHSSWKYVLEYQVWIEAGSTGETVKPEGQSSLEEAWAAIWGQ